MGVIRKYEPGEPFRSMADAIRWIECGGWVFDRHKPQCPGWALSWSVSYLRNGVATHRIRRAIETDAWMEANSKSEAA